MVKWTKIGTLIPSYLFAQICQFAEDHKISLSAAARRLLFAGLKFNSTQPLHQKHPADHQLAKLLADGTRYSLDSLGWAMTESGWKVNQQELRILIARSGGYILRDGSVFCPAGLVNLASTLPPPELAAGKAG